MRKLRVWSYCFAKISLRIDTRLELTMPLFFLVICDIPVFCFKGERSPMNRNFLFLRAERGISSAKCLS